MLFTRTAQFHFSIPKEYLAYWLIGNHVRIHDMDFEVFEEDHSLHIVPHAEQVTKIKTLPVTRVDLQEDGNKTKVVITSEMRPLDSGGPILILLFCGFLVLISLIFLFVLPGAEKQLTYLFFGLSLVIFTLFFIRMQLGYFDYVRKVRGYVKGKGDQITCDVRRQLFKHKVK